MPFDRQTSHPRIRQREGSLGWLKENSQGLRQQDRIFQETTAYHAILTLPPDSDQPHFLYCNPRLKEILGPVDNESAPNYFLNERLKKAIETNDWEKEPNPSFIVPIGDPENEKTKYYGLSIEKMEENRYHLTGRDITDKEIIRQQREYAMTHDPMTGFLNATGARKLFESINQEKREHKRPKKVTVFYIDLAGVKTINDAKGHSAGDEYIIKSFQKIASLFREDEVVIIRIHSTGDELLIFLPDIEANDIEKISERLNYLRDTDQNLSFYFGNSTGTPQTSGHFNFSDIIDQADAMQNIDKNSRKSK